MNKLNYIGAILTVTALISIPSFAATSNNRGAIVKVSASCEQIINQVNNNRGSIIKVTGDGTCDIEEVINSGQIKGNRGSIIKIDGVCGFVPAEITDNRGSIIKVSSVGHCPKVESGSHLVNKISDNRGSIIKTETSGDMNIDNNKGSIIKTKTDGNVSVEGNKGSIIKVETEGKVTTKDNNGSIVKKEDNKSDKENRKKEAPKEGRPKVSEIDRPESNDKAQTEDVPVTELPRTGAGAMTATLVGTIGSVLAYGATYAVTRRN